jgi:alanine dehydrogenase
MNYLKTGVFKTSHKENEKRLPIYPSYLKNIDKELLENIHFEEGYGLDYGITDAEIKNLGGSIAKRKDLFKKCELLILPKPMADDLYQMQNNQILCGWTHAVQQTEIAQIGIDKKLTFIAWEEMNQSDAFGHKKLHIFYRNNELAGYAGIIHYLGLKGFDGFYGPRRKVSILGYGAVSRGAIYALHGRGFNNIHVYTLRPTHLIADKNPDIWYHQMYRDADGIFNTKSVEGKHNSLINELAESDIIFNGVMQNVNEPLMFIRNENEANQLKPFTSIIDISCDNGMGFYFAKPTSFEHPIFDVGNNITYYSVDHTPTYLWNAASREISLSLQPFLKNLMSGEDFWADDHIIFNAIDIHNGVIKNDNIINFQKREFCYPYKIKE